MPLSNYMEHHHLSGVAERVTGELALSLGLWLQMKWHVSDWEATGLHMYSKQISFGSKVIRLRNTKTGIMIEKKKNLYWMTKNDSSMCCSLVGIGLGQRLANIESTA